MSDAVTFSCARCGKQVRFPPSVMGKLVCFECEEEFKKAVEKYWKIGE